MSVFLVTSHLVAEFEKVAEFSIFLNILKNVDFNRFLETSNDFGICVGPVLVLFSR